MLDFFRLLSSSVPHIYHLYMPPKPSFFFPSSAALPQFVLVSSSFLSQLFCLFLLYLDLFLPSFSQHLSFLLLTSFPVLSFPFPSSPLLSRPFPSLSFPSFIAVPSTHIARPLLLSSLLPHSSSFPPLSLPLSSPTSSVTPRLVATGPRPPVCRAEAGWAAAAAALCALVLGSRYFLSAIFGCSFIHKASAKI